MQMWSALPPIPNCPGLPPSPHVIFAFFSPAYSAPATLLAFPQAHQASPLQGSIVPSTWNIFPNLLLTSFGSLTPSNIVQLSPD